ncbi:M20/M25/M40 family metallo-hydrolase [Candidatus Sumerlaeota bacterium]|nr:M20/M25/M40 family metallo-hydrolase [Candidatus Sumerlaeota bacterium]
MYKILKNHTERSKREMIDFTRELIKTPSLSLAENKIAELIEKKMKELAYDKVFRDEWGNVIGVIFGNEHDPAVILNSHMDTVGVKDAAEWRLDPYGALMENGKIFGLGASDCKSGLAAQIYAGAILKHGLLPLKGALVVAATAAEENGRSIGVRGLLEDTLPSLNIKPRYAILGETTNLDLYYGHDGWVMLNILVESDQPFHVEDATNGIYRDIEENYAHIGNGDNGEYYHITPPEFEETPGTRRGRILLSRKLGQEENCADLIHSLNKNAHLIAENYGAVAVQVDVKKECQTLYTGKTAIVENVVNAWMTDPYHPLIERSRQTLAAAGIAAKPMKWQLNRLEMGTAGNVLLNEFQIPTMGFGPGNLAMAHAANEYVETENIPRAAYGAAAIAHGLIGYPVFGWTSDEI